MTRKPNLVSINCTSCGAGLDVLGGGRVQVHVCGYCGAQLDAQSDFAVLQTFANRERPASPFSIGMTGAIDGVDFTVIGTLGQQERYAGLIWDWVDHQVFSPTHGYGYLTVENGHLTFTRRFRNSTRPNWIGASTVEHSDHRPTIRADGEQFTYHETTTSRITFIKGEFNWRPEIDAKSTSVSVLGRNRMLSFESSASERQVVATRYLPTAQTYAAFGVSPPQEPSGFHVLKPFTAGPNARFFAVASVGFAAVAVASAVAMSGMGSQNWKTHRVAVGELPYEIPFEVTTPNRLARVEVRADVDNSWAFATLALRDPQGDDLFEAGRLLERYSGRDGDGAWREGNGRAALRFVPPEAGVYTIEIDVPEAATWARDGAPLSEVAVRLKEGLVSGMWMLGVALGFGLFALYHASGRYIHQVRRMRQSDWSDD